MFTCTSQMSDFLVLFNNKLMLWYCRVAFLYRTCIIKIDDLPCMSTANNLVPSFTHPVEDKNLIEGELHS